MNNIKKKLAAIMALTMAFGVTACGDTSSDESGATDETTTTAEVTTTTAVTVAINENNLVEGEDEIIANVAEKLPDKELENTTIKWLAHYDINPSTSGASKSVALNLFETKYDGVIKWYTTTWENRYNDLSTYVLGGEGIDFFPSDTAALPKGVINGMFQSIDEYIDVNAEPWSTYKDVMDIFNFNGKHYCIITGVGAEAVCLYNKKTIEENGLEDPYEQWKAGEWNWDTFKESLMAYVDPDNDCYGLDGYWAEKALFLSAGVPSISSVDGTLTSNLMDPTVEKAMTFAQDLYTNNLIINREIFDWAEQPQFMGEGKELFYIIGAWGVKSDPATWTTKMNPEDLGMVPVPSPAGSDNYMGIAIDGGWCLCKNAGNPEGVAAYGECCILGGFDEDAIAISDRKTKDDFQWTDELIQIEKDINEAARLHPVVDLSTGVSSDVAQLTTDGGDNIGLRGPFHGTDWATSRDEIAQVVEMLVAEEDAKLKTLE